MFCNLETKKTCYPSVFRLPLPAMRHSQLGRNVCISCKENSEKVVSSSPCEFHILQHLTLTRLPCFLELMGAKA